MLRVTTIGNVIAISSRACTSGNTSFIFLVCAVTEGMCCCLVSPGAMVIGAATMGSVPRVMGGASGKGNPAGATSGAGTGANSSTPVVVDTNSSAAAIFHSADNYSKRRLPLSVRGRHTLSRFLAQSERPTPASQYSIE